MRGTIAKRLRNAARSVAKPSEFIDEQYFIKKLGQYFVTGCWAGYRRVYKDLKKLYKENNGTVAQCLKLLMEKP